MSTSGSSAGIGFAVSVNTVRQVVPALIAHGAYPHPYLGTETLDLTPSTAEILREAGMDVPLDTGLLVIETVTDGPANRAGVRGSSRVVRYGRYRVPIDGDIITAVNGNPVDSLQELTVFLEPQTTVGDTVELTIIREGKEQIIPVTLGERPM
jgi:S1-C subfamily serine protease